METSGPIERATGVVRIALTRTEAAEAIAASKGFIDLEIRRGRLRARKLGRKVVILRSDLLKYLGATDAN